MDDRGTRYVWHCKERLTYKCRLNKRCRGTECNMYEPLSEDSAAIDKEFLKRKEE